MPYAVVRYTMKRGARGLLEPEEHWYADRYSTLEEAEAAKARKLRRAGPLPPAVSYAVEELPALTEEAELARRQFFGSLTEHVGVVVDGKRVPPSDGERRALAGALIGKPYPVSRMRWWPSAKWVAIRDYLELHKLEGCEGGETCPLVQAATRMLGRAPEEERVAA